MPCFTSFRGHRHQGYRDDGCLPGNIGVRGRLLESGRFYSSSIRKSENEIEETRKNLSYVSANKGMRFIGCRNFVPPFP